MALWSRGTSRIAFTPNMLSRKLLQKRVSMEASGIVTGKLRACSTCMAVGQPVSPLFVLPSGSLDEGSTATRNGGRKCTPAEGSVGSDGINSRILAGMPETVVPEG